MRKKITVGLATLILFGCAGEQKNHTPESQTINYLRSMYVEDNTSQASSFLTNDSQDLLDLDERKQQISEFEVILLSSATDYSDGISQVTVEISGIVSGIEKKITREYSLRRSEGYWLIELPSS